ncbi:unnamed protein product [Dovyalis caffra]|uniref:Uncharacterized protein n=1 Tax=Dovyalis caffra TaxID=77055 RepID=A0AAV1QNL6_9ROSI|nr:unnamed protein product [Dovyalis caffra]
MDIPERLLQYRYHFALAITASVVLSLLLYAAPRLLFILAYFWPLFASTTVFLILILVFGGTVSQLATDSHAYGEKAGEGLLDYVAGQPETVEHSQKYESDVMVEIRSEVCGIIFPNHNADDCISLCLLSKQFPEDRDHLFFTFNKESVYGNAFCRKVLLKKCFISTLLRLAWCFYIYVIWKERIRKIHGEYGADANALVD